MVEDHDPVASAVLAHAISDGCNHPGRFVTEDARGGMRSGRNLFQIGSTDSARMHTDEQFTRTDRGHRDCLKADVIDTAIDGGVHSCGDYMIVGLDRGLSGCGHERVLDDVTGRIGANTNRQ